ncbi:MAG TPA: fibrillarin-like rRNA/tRNA 2'-O-methyltransferase [archaeon]|nr:fibrillarin-like rRNA/tRNA 2'-O-methyltransferase [archaeon]
MPEHSIKKLPPNVIFIKDKGKFRLASRNFTPEIQVYGERLIHANGLEYRLWSAHRSKLGAMIEKKMTIPVCADSLILYLGGGTGTTASHVSDIVSEGKLFVVEFSPRAMQDLLSVCTNRKNMIPVLADANKPIAYKAVAGIVDVIYQDVAQPNQADIALINARTLLKPKGYLIMVIKARSIDSSISPNKVFEQEIAKLEVEFEILEKKGLKPFHEDHLAIIAQRK